MIMQAILTYPPHDLAEGVRADISLALEACGIQTYTAHHEVSPG